MKKIYVITTFEKMDINYDDIGDVRIIGWYKDLSMAEKIVASNSCDINEGYYNWVMIEEVPEGLYPFSTLNLRKLYNFNKEKEKYELINDVLTEAIIYKLPTIG